MATDEEINRIRRGLWSLSRKRRERAMDYVRALSIDDAVQILTPFFLVNRDRRQWTTLSMAIIVVVSAALISIVVLAASYLAFVDAPVAVMILALGAPIGLSPVLLWRRSLYPTAALMLIDERPDSRYVKPLLQTLALIDVALPREMRNALMKSLQRLDRNSFAELTSQERSQLTKKLAVSNSELQKMILTVLQIGEDTASIPQVQRLLRTKPYPWIAEAADACLSHLNQVREAQKVGENLLRSSQFDADPDTLLRAASSSEEREVKQLLRSNEAPNQ